MDMSVLCPKIRKLVTCMLLIGIFSFCQISSETYTKISYLKTILDAENVIANELKAYIEKEESYLEEKEEDHLKEIKRYWYC